MIVDSLMTTRVVTVHLDDKLTKLQEIFINTRVHHVLVAENGRLRGVITDRDFFKAVSPYIGTPAETTHDTATINKKAHQVMSRNPVTIKAGSNIREAVSLIYQHGVTCLPILNDEDKIAGILTWRDVFRGLEARYNKPAAPEQRD